MAAMRRVIRSAVYLPILPSTLKLALRNRVSASRVEERSRFGAAKRILVVQPHNSLGDLVLSIPFLEEIHRLWPGAEIGVLVGHAMTTLFERLPFVHSVIGYGPSRFGPPFARYQDAARLMHLRRRLQGAYDLAIDPRWDSDSFAYLARLACFLSAAPIRVGYSGKVDGKDPSLDEFLTKSAFGGAGEHDLIRKLRLFERVGLSTRRVADDEQFQASHALLGLANGSNSRAQEILRSAGIQPGERFAVLAPSASHAQRIWPLETLSEVVNSLAQKLGLRFIAIGSPADVPLCNRLVALNPDAVVSLAGKTTVLELSSVLSGAALFVGNDSGPAHIAGLLGTNTVVISPFPSDSGQMEHTNSPARFRPCGPLVKVLQPKHPLAPCRDSCRSSHAHCISQVKAEEVIFSCLALLHPRTSEASTSRPGWSK